MGSKWSSLVGRFFNRQTHRADPEIRVGMLGLDNAGKTTILFNWKYQDTGRAAALPTIGLNVENIRCGSYLLNIWDVGGGQPRTRLLWHHYNQRDVRVIIFVVDAADKQRLPQAAAELHWLACWREELAKAVFLVFANKQDLRNALGAEEVATALGLQQLRQHWTVQECCALSGTGLWEGLRQMENMLAASKHDKRIVMCK